MRAVGLLEGSRPYHSHLQVTTTDEWREAGPMLSSWEASRTRRGRGALPHLCPCPSPRIPRLSSSENSSVPGPPASGVEPSLYPRRGGVRRRPGHPSAVSQEAWSLRDSACSSRACSGRALRRHCLQAAKMPLCGREATSHLEVGPLCSQEGLPRGPLGGQCPARGHPRLGEEWPGLGGPN